VNSTPELRKVKFALPSRFGRVEAAQVFVVADSNPIADSEAMNSRDDPHRVALQSRKADLSGREFDYSFAPFAVTLLELRLAGER
jgi:alpha-L-arabinofuranosidase